MPIASQWLLLSFRRRSHSAPLLAFCLFLRFALAADAAAYATQFPLTEDPILEGGHWFNTRAVAIDWGNFSTTPGFAFGSKTNDTRIRYNDPTAVLTGSWGPDQSAEGTVDAGSATGAAEVEMRLRTSLSAHRAVGYEITFSVAGGGNGDYLIIVKWNGALADFTYLTRLNGPQYAVKTGDVIKATMVGNLITAFKNGVAMAQVTDSTFAQGNPGMGINEGANGNYGLSSFKAWDRLEAENLTVAKYDAPAKPRIIKGHPGLSRGEASILESTAVNQSITYLLPNVAAGKYDVRVGIEKNRGSGMWQLHAGQPDRFAETEHAVGEVQDAYSATPACTEIDLGTWTTASSGDQWFQFLIIGKNAGSGGYAACFDYLTLIPQ